MEFVEAKTGTWHREASGELHGEVGSTLRAYCIAGEATDKNYQVGTKLRIVKGTTASLIVFYVFF